MIKEIIHNYNDLEGNYNELTNHLNMGLYALYEIGATSEEITQFAEGYLSSRHIDKAETGHGLINDENYTAYLGQYGSYKEFKVFYKSKMNTQDSGQVFDHYINRLSDGFAGGAFHGLIRASYAFELQDQEELINSLAYLSEVYLKLDHDYDQYPIEDAMETVKALSTSEHFKTKNFTRQLITGRMIDIYEDEHFKPRKLSDEDLTIKNMYNITLNLYGMTKDFTALHGFTSTHALSILKPILKDFKGILQNHWFNLQLAYLSTNCTSLFGFEKKNTNTSWEDIFNYSRTSYDVHHIKLNYSLYKMSILYGQEDYAKSIASIE